MYALVRSRRSAGRLCLFFFVGDGQYFRPCSNWFIIQITTKRCHSLTITTMGRTHSTRTVYIRSACCYTTYSALFFSYNIISIRVFDIGRYTRVCARIYCTVCAAGRVFTRAIPQKFQTFHSSPDNTTKYISYSVLGLAFYRHFPRTRTPRFNT